MLRKRAETHKFFEEMEANIKIKIERARVEVSSPSSTNFGLDRDSEFSRPRRGSIGGPTRYVRTISSMDGKISTLVYDAFFLLTNSLYNWTIKTRF